jgi:hypothetical protein
MPADFHPQGRARIAWLRDSGHRSRASTSAPTAADSVDYPDSGYKLAEGGRFRRGRARDRRLRLGHRHLDRRQPQSRLPLRAGRRPAVGALAREHNDANVLALGARLIGPDMAKACVAAFLGTDFAGGRHQRRVDQLSQAHCRKATDGSRRRQSERRPAQGLLHRPLWPRPIRRSPTRSAELDRQQNQIELIASENIVSRAVLEAQGSVLTNKYAEGYPGALLSGLRPSDSVETLAIERAKQLFGCGFANVQPHSGAQANGAVMLALTKPGDTIMGMSLAAGGHLTHGARRPVGKWFNAVQYGVRRDDHLVDFDEVERLAASTSRS